MVETGSIIPLWLNLMAIILPLLTAIVIFIRQSYKEVTLTLLMLLSLLLFAHNLLFSLSAFDLTHSLFYRSLFETAEFVLLILIFRNAVQQTFFKEWVNYLLVAFISVVMTLHATQNSTPYLLPIAITEAILLVLFSLITLLMLIRNQFIFIFHSTLFWIAGGTLFYASMILATEILGRNGWFENYKENEKQLLLSTFNIIRLIFYLVAALIRQSKQQEEEWEHFKNSSPEFPPR